ncbi:MAG: hypothetical protein ACOCP4_04090 [Candidatus Woesearchaeota archaeon]
MLFYILFFIMIIFIIHLCKPSKNNIDSISMCVILTIIGALFLLVISIAITEYHGKVVEKYSEYMYNISSLHNNTEISGSFFIGSGSIDETEYYFTFVKIGDNTYKRKKFRTDDTYIIESNSGKPRVIKKTANMKLNDYITPSWLTTITRPKYYMYVPEGTIIKDFRLK